MRFVALLIGCFLLYTVNAFSQFTGCFDGSNWITNTTNTNGTVFIQSGGMSLVADTDGSGNGAGTILDCNTTGNGNVSSCIVIPFSGQLIFDWAWTGGNLSTLLTEPFGYCINGTATTLTSINPPPFGTAVGNDTVIVMAGDTFCFVVSSLFADSHPTIPTTIGITNFSGPCSPTTVSCYAGFTYTVSSVWDSLIFTDTSSANISQWLWTFGDGDSSTLANPTHKYSAPGTYNVCLQIRDTANCTDTVCQSIAVISTGINDSFNPSQTSCIVYPNPGNGRYHVTLTNIVNNEGLKYSVIDLKGNSIIENQILYPQNGFNLDLSTQNSGQYILQVHIRNNILSKIIIKP